MPAQAQVLRRPADPQGMLSRIAPNTFAGQIAGRAIEVRLIDRAWRASVNGRMVGTGRTMAEAVRLAQRSV